MAKKFDFNQFLLQRGEQIGLVVAGLLMLLLVVPGVLAFFSAGSADEKAKVLNDGAQTVETVLRQNQPTGAEKPAADSKEKLVALTSVVTSDPINPDPYRLTALAPIGGPQVGGRRNPKVYPIDEARAKAFRLQAKAYIFDPGTPPKIYVLATEGGARPGAGSGPAMAGAGGPRGGSGDGRPGGGSGVMGPPGFGSPGGLAGLLGQAGRGKRGKSISLFEVPKQGSADDGKSDGKMRSVPLTEVDNLKGEHPAVQVKPVRMAIIAASFPYKKQVEEFRTRLGLRSNDDVLAETDGSKDARANFRFMGIEVERREVDGNGDPVPGKAGQYQLLDVANQYRDWMVLTGREVEPEDPALKPIIFPGLVMSRLKQLRGDETPAGGSMGMSPGSMSPPPSGSSGDIRPPPGSSGGPRGMGGPPGTAGAGDHSAPPTVADQYEPIEKQLETLKKTLEALKDKNPNQVGAPGRFTGDGLDPFSPPPEPGAAGGAATMPGLGAGATVGAAGGMGEGDGSKPAGTVLPDHCLVRVLDLTIQPGKTYEYRLRVRMANPNFGRRDAASPAYARDRALTSEWSKTPIQVRIDPELHYYAVDEKVWDQQQAEEGRKKASRYTGPYANTPINARTQVVLQAHRWLPSVSASEGSRMDIGEWVVAERLPVYRGEYLGHRERIKVPYWRTTREAWLIANDGKYKKVPGVQVPFGYEGNDPNQPEAILVDFNTGSVGYDRVVSRTDDRVDTKPVRDASAGEVLILNPDGQLILREGARDASDTNREKRLADVKKRVKSLEKSTTPGKGPAAGGGFATGD
jgi:hypothetical protein